MLARSINFVVGARAGGRGRYVDKSAARQQARGSSSVGNTRRLSSWNIKETEAEEEEAQAAIEAGIAKLSAAKRRREVADNEAKKKKLDAVHAANLERERRLQDGRRLCIFLVWAK